MYSIYIYIYIHIYIYVYLSYNMYNIYVYMYTYIYIYITNLHICMYSIREMGGAPRNLAPRNHILVRIVKPSGCHRTDAFGGTNISLTLGRSWRSRARELASPAARGAGAALRTGASAASGCDRYIYIYIYRERERDIEREIERERDG